MRIPVQDAEIEVQVHEGSGPWILLVHGLGGSSRAWDSLVPFLSSQARVVVPDLRGCGASTRGTRPYTLALVAEDLGRVVRGLGIERCIAVGHSLGGVIVQELLASEPEWLCGAVLISTSSRVGEKAAENWRRLADTVEQRGLGDSPAAAARGFAEQYAEAHPDVVAAYARLGASADRHVYAEQARAASSYDYSKALAAVRCPVLVLQGLADRLTPPGGSVLLHRALPAHARLEMIEEAGHNLPIEMPALVARLIVEFARQASSD
ncbi:MAG TPA: alpha/beta hydrolase [Candidatus Binatia bacterium]|jgi:pimeloyl-ACP methyl ester carboxylesterase